MFCLDQSPTYWWPVKFTLPSATGASQATHTFDAEFKRIGTDEAEAMGERVKHEKMSDKAVAAELIVGWSGITDAQGAAVPYSQAALKRVLGMPNVAGAIVSAFFASHAKAAEKN